MKILNDNKLNTIAKPLESCYEYINLLPIIPCCPPDHSGMNAKHKAECRSPGKAPLIKGWPGRTETTESELDQWVRQWPNANPGLPLGSTSGYVGIDIDGETGEQLLKEWSSGDLPVTWEFTTGAGRRLIYRLPEGVILKKYSQADREKEHQECALLGQGQQTIIPPAAHQSGREYRWTPGRDPFTFGPAALTPVWMIKKMSVKKVSSIYNARKKREKKSNADGPDPTEVLTKLTERCQRFEKDWQQQRAGGLDEDTWFLWTSLLVATGFSEAATVISEASEKHDDRSSERLEKLIKRQEEDPIPPVRCASFGCSEEVIQTCHMRIWLNKDSEITNSPAAFIMNQKQATVRYFNGKTFLPRRLGDHIMEDFNFIYLCQQLYVYRNGVYVSEGADLTRLECRERLGDEFRKNRVDETVYYIETSSFCDIEDTRRYPLIINCKNGIYDFEKDEFLPHDPTMPFITQLNVNYDPDAKCPGFLSFLEEILPPETQVLLQEVTGYLIVPVTKAQKAFIANGPGGTGKTTYLAVAEHFLGKNNVSNIAWQDLGDRFRTAELFGKLANIAADLPSKALDDASVFKSIVGEDSIMAERKFQPPFSFKPFARLLFSCNKLPFSKDQSSGFYRRPIIIPFERVIDESKVDKELKQKLFEEADGILQWALLGLKRLMENNFKFSETDVTKEMLNKYRVGNSSALSFIQDTCVVHPGNPLLEIGKAELYSKYKIYCEENGFRYSSQRNFNAEIETNYPGVLKTLSGPRRVKVWKGIDLLEGVDEEEDIF